MKIKKAIPRLFTKHPPLWFCLLMDVIGCATYLFPGLGEWGDTIWAPLSGFIFYQAFGSIVGVFGGLFSFLEEAFPFTDIIPTFTIAWLIQRYKTKNKDIEISNERRV